MAYDLVRDPGCTRCRLHKSAEHVCLLGKGPKKTKVAVIGEAPGAKEDASGEPFVGAAGGILRGALKRAGINPKKVFITNAVSCRPANNKTPTKGEINACKHWLDYQLDLVSPKYVLLLGNVPCQAVLDKKGITKLRGRPIEKDGVTYFPAFHPAALLHDPSKKEAFESDIQFFGEIVKNEGLNQDEEFNPIEVSDEATFEKMLDALTGVVSFDLETSCLYPWKWIHPKKGGKNPFYDTPVITAVGFGTEKAQWSIPWDHYETSDIWSVKRRKRMIRQMSARLKKCTVVAQNGKFDAVWTKVINEVTWDIDFDTMLAHYLLDENDRHGLEHLAQLYYGATPYDVDPTREPWNVVFPYHCKDLLYTRKLYYTLSKKLRKEGNVERVFYEIMMPCVKLFAKAEVNGVFVDHEKFDEAEEYLTERICEAKRKLKRYKRGVNWRSPQQVGALFFGKKKDGGLGLKIVEKTKTGNPGTSEGVLKRIDHPAARDLLTLRGHNQQLSFFIDGWKPFLHDHLLHPSFKLHGAVTGRPSCANPNLQQVPRDPRIRSLIIAPPGWELVECDLSQVELRVAAELANETAMLETFYNGKDIHWQTAIREIARQASMAELVLGTASKITGSEIVNYGKAIDILLDSGHRVVIKTDGKWKEYRKKAKATNFGYLYGMYPKKFQTYAFDNYGIVVSEEQAKQSRKDYFNLYSDLPDWHDRQKRYARRHGYVTTMTGRKRRLPDAQIPYDCKERRSAERMAINSPVQGFAAEMNLMAGIQFDAEFPHDVRVIGTIHDAVLFWARKTQIHVTVPRMLEIMRRPKIMDDLNIRIRVPIEAEAAIGPWSLGVSLEEYMEKVA